MTSGLGRTPEASLPEGFFPCWNSCKDWHFWRDEVAPEPKSEQGPFAMVQTSSAGREPSWKSFRWGSKNLGGVKRTDEYHVRLTEASTKQVSR